MKIVASAELWLSVIRWRTFSQSQVSYSHRRAITAAYQPTHQLSTSKPTLETLKQGVRFTYY